MVNQTGRRLNHKSRDRSGRCRKAGVQPFVITANQHRLGGFFRTDVDSISCARRYDPDDQYAVPAEPVKRQVEHHQIAGNWLRPRERFPEHNSTCAPVSSSAVRRASRRIIGYAPHGTRRRGMPAFAQHLLRAVTRWSLLAQITSTLRTMAGQIAH